MSSSREFPVRLLARLFLGVVWVALGSIKAVDPVAFLRLVREFHVVESAPGLNLVAAVLPWFELFCGALLLLGLRVRAAACLQALLLAAFTVLIVTRGLAVHLATGVPLWWVRYDCGCGTGEVYVGVKLVENAGLIALAWFVANRRAQVERDVPIALEPDTPSRMLCRASVLQTPVRPDTTKRRQQD